MIGLNTGFETAEQQTLHWGGGGGTKHKTKINNSRKKQQQMHCTKCERHCHLKALLVKKLLYTTCRIEGVPN